MVTDTQPTIAQDAARLYGSMPSATPVRHHAPLPLDNAAIAAAWNETEQAYQEAALYAEGSALHAMVAKRAAAQATYNARLTEAQYDLGIEDFVTRDPEGNMTLFKPKNETERKAARTFALHNDAGYQRNVAVADQLERDAAEAQSHHERAILDCRLARLRLEMLIGLQRGAAFTLGTGTEDLG